MAHISELEEALLARFGPLNPVEVEILKTVARHGNHILTKEELAASLGLDKTPTDLLLFNYHFDRLPDYFIGVSAKTDDPEGRFRVSIHSTGIAYLLKNDLL